MRVFHHLAVATIFALALTTAADAGAFHDGGVGSCSGCHVIHDSRDGVAVAPDGVGLPLLIRATPTDVCLSCHAEDQGMVLGSDPLSPPPERGGGNFVHLFEDDINDSAVAVVPIGGHRCGHNVISVAYGLDVDPDLPVAPGGSYPSADLGCTSCHDPHGNGNFRLLRGAGDVGGFVFVSGAPTAEGVELVGAAETPTNHTAYRSGWSAWCANCHGYFHRSNWADFDHPVDRAMGRFVADAYNAYAGDANPTGGLYATAGLPEVPVQDPAADVSGMSGANTSSRLNCMSCHRAHATSAPAALRWDPQVLHLSQDGSASGSYPIPNPYPDLDQRSLCVKCHWGDTAGHGFDRPCLECHAAPD